jgi:hypothetical protein
MNSPEIKAFIRKNSSLFWYIPDDKKEDIDEEVLVEFILNYGDWDTVLEMFRILDIKKAAQVFFTSLNKSERSKGNYKEQTINYFTKFFNRYAS